MSENENDRKSWRDRFGEHAPAPDKPDYAPNTRLFKYIYPLYINSFSHLLVFRSKMAYFQ